MRYLLISILLCTLFACKSPFSGTFVPSTTISKEINNPYFSDPQIDYVYKTDVTVYGKAFSGILIVKKVASQNHRLVFTSQFGSTLFDIEFTKDDHKIHSILEDLDRKIIINTLIQDFSLILQEKDDAIETYIYQENIIVRKAKKGKRYNYYFYNPENILMTITNTTETKPKFEIEFQKQSNNIAKSIYIKHKSIKLTIQLKLLEK